MKKKLLCIILVALFIGAAGFVVIKYKAREKKKETAVYTLLERKGEQAQTEEWIRNKKTVNNLLAMIDHNPYDKKSLISLANFMIMEARATGNYNYYDAAAMKYVNDVLTIEPDNFEALSLKALVQLSQHHFSDGLATAEKARTINPYNSFVYGILVDANVEMGHYDSAVAAADKMMGIRPDLRSFARASYLREIHGDFPGAIEGMQKAIDAGAPGDESTEWSRVQLGQLYENVGDLKRAAFQYAFAINERPGYPYALAGLARIAIASKEYDKALAFYLKADSLVNDFTFKEAVADVYRLSGKPEAAKAISAKALEGMEERAKAAISDENIGHYADKEMAEAYIKKSLYGKAVEHALAEYNRRPENIDVNETLAWAYSKQGDVAKAMQHIKAALKTNSRHPRLLCRAGIIFLNAGDKVQAKKYLNDGLGNNPNIFPDLKKESVAAINQL
ncbi:MAG: transposase [Chitinophagaceae bacterium]|nr:transposase [Chitinophagaceae bacterium]